MIVCASNKLVEVECEDTYAYVYICSFVLYVNIFLYDTGLLKIISKQLF